MKKWETTRSKTGTPWDPKTMSFGFSFFKITKQVAKYLYLPWKVFWFDIPFPPSGVQITPEYVDN